MGDLDQVLEGSQEGQGSAPFLGAPSRGFYRLGLALLQPIKLQPKLVLGLAVLLVSAGLASAGLVSVDLVVSVDSVA